MAEPLPIVVVSGPRQALFLGGLLLARPAQPSHAWQEETWDLAAVAPEAWVLSPSLPAGHAWLWQDHGLFLWGSALILPLVVPFSSGDLQPAAEQSKHLALP